MRHNATKYVKSNAMINYTPYYKENTQQQFFLGLKSASTGDTDTLGFDVFAGPGFHDSGVSAAKSYALFVSSKSVSICIFR
eukprot:CAMPEP_0176356594 /NCGR_PEP_ID=MMETSP0126-20121128/14129_1 /TAXON_ID=141414 ORGANISM="Strombidinopsis acuminatum, Strain SPMC142" /NCGR_SAMPLE_ID=MMETSP0126 /ASSEMBLY_ACC=CAM_ASM_000229 /LENGTH=80 /DNA_ID=CAMNT_0017709757 /DNA_START=706 /DNA_END=945 /DNA_ORIENTATION=-